MAHPHIAPKNQQAVFASHCQIASLFHLPLVSVISSIRVRVINDSVRPITANISAYGVIIYIISINDLSICGI